MAKHSGSSNSKSILNSALIIAILALAASAVVAGCASSPSASNPPSPERERYAAFGMWGMADGVSNDTANKPAQPSTLVRVPGEPEVTKENIAQMQKTCAAGNQKVCLSVAMFKLKSEKDVKGIVAFCRQAAVDCKLNSKIFPNQKKSVVRTGAAQWSTKTSVVSSGRDSELEVSVY